MTIIDVLAALEEGAYPTNEQLTALLQRLLDSSLLSADISAERKAAYEQQLAKSKSKSSKDAANKNAKNQPLAPLDRAALSNETTAVLDEAAELLRALQRLLVERNPQEEVQEALWRTRGAAEAAVSGLMEIKNKPEKREEVVKKLRADNKKNKKERKKVRKQEKKKRKALKKQGPKAKRLMREVKAEGKTASAHTRTLLRLVLLQPTLRHVLSDLFFYLETTLEQTGSATFAQAQADLGQANSALAAQARTDVSVLQDAVESGAAAALGGARLAKEAVQKKREEVQDTVLADKARRTEEGAVELLPDSSNGTVEKKNKVPAGQKAAEQLAVAQALLDNAKAGVKEAHDKAKLTANDVQQRKDELLREVQKAESTSVPTEQQQQQANGTLPYDALDAAQMAAVSSIRLGRHTLGKEGEAVKLVQTGRQQLQKNARENWTPEMQQRLFTRVRKMFADLQAQPDYRTSILYFINLVEKLVPISTSEPTPTTKESKLDFAKRKLDAALGDTAEPMLQFLDNFAGQGNDSLRSVLQNASALANDTVGEQAGQESQAGITVKGFWRKIDAYLRNMLLQEGYALSPKAEQGAREIAKDYRALDQEYRRKVVAVLSGFGTFMHAFQKDAILGEIAKHAKNFAKRLIIGGKGSNGLPSKALWHDMRVVILPFLFDRIGVLPIPRVRYLHPDFEVAVENLAIQLRQLLPNTFDLRMTNDLHVDFQRLKDSNHAHQLKIKIKGMGIRVHKLAYAFIWKKGIKFTDKGIGDLNIDGFGLTLYIDVPKDTSKNFFIVKKVKAKLKTLSLKVRETNHRILHGFANALVNSYLTKRILRHFIAYGVSLGLKELDLALLRARLNEDVEEDRLTLEEIKKQMAAIRDLLRKYHEQAGEIQVDFTREEDPANKKKWEDAHAIKWIKGQVENTGKKEIVRNEWRSNAFDLEGMNSVQAPAPAAAVVDDSRAEETTEEAAAQGKPMVTGQALVDKTANVVQQQEGEKLAKPQLESKAGKKALKEGKSDRKQRKALKKQAKV